MHLACVNLHMSMPEALAAATINAAAALGLSEDYGSLEEGKWADMIIINANKWVHVYMALYIYRIAGNIGGIELNLAVEPKIAWYGIAIHIILYATATCVYMYGDPIYKLPNLNLPIFPAAILGSITNYY